jgi:hypothetical protein
MLQEPMNEFECPQRCRFPLIGIAIFETKGYLAVFEGFNAVVGDGYTMNIGRQVF